MGSERGEGIRFANSYPLFSLLTSHISYLIRGVRSPTSDGRTGVRPYGYEVTSAAILEVWEVIFLRRKVALAEGLGGLDTYFRRRGYEVLPPERAEDASALVVSGATDNFTGDERRKTGVPVINAEGKTPEEIFHQVERATAVKGL